MAGRSGVGETPQERLLVRGPKALTDGELFSIVLRTKPEEATRLLDRLGGLGRLSEARRNLRRRKGFTESRAVSALALVELSCRMSRTRVEDRPQFERPYALAEYLRQRYAEGDQEVMGALFLNLRGYLIHEMEVFRGTMTRTSVEPRALLREALEWCAPQFVIFHVHPSGDPTPSAEDLGFTKRLADAADVIGVRLMDHLILGDAGSWVSLMRSGVLDDGRCARREKDDESPE